MDREEIRNEIKGLAEEYNLSDEDFFDRLFNLLSLMFRDN